MEEVLEKAKIIYDYLNVQDKIKEIDTILCCCSIDLSLVDISKELYNKYNPKQIIYSGYKGKGTIGKIKGSEAKRFKDYALKLGIDENKIITEERSVNTWQNIRNSLKKIEYNDLIIIHKPYALRRTKLICKKLNINCKLVSTKLDCNKYLIELSKRENIKESDIISEMVAEIFYLKHNKLFNLEKTIIPKEVWESYLFLKNKGYNKYII